MQPNLYLQLCRNTRVKQVWTILLDTALKKTKTQNVKQKTNIRQTVTNKSDFSILTKIHVIMYKSAQNITTVKSFSPITYMYSRVGCNMQVCCATAHCQVGGLLDDRQTKRTCGRCQPSYNATCPTLPRTHVYAKSGDSSRMKTHTCHLLDQRWPRRMPLSAPCPPLLILWEKDRASFVSKWSLAAGHDSQLRICHFMPIEAAREKGWGQSTGSHWRRETIIQWSPCH